MKKTDLFSFLSRLRSVSARRDEHHMRSNLSRFCFPVLLVSFILLLSPASAHAAKTQDTGPLAILQRIETARAKTHSLFCKIEVRIPKESGKWSHFPMTVEFLAPRFYRTEMKMAIEGDVLTVADGKTIWSYEKKRKRVYRQDQQKAIDYLREWGPYDPTTALLVPEVPLKDLFVLESASHRKGLLTVLLRPIKPVPGYEEVKVVFREKTLVPVFAETFSGGKTIGRLVFKKCRKNIKIDPARFRFTPPAGVKVSEVQ